MKLKNFLAMMAIALCAVACSDNDDKKEDTVIPAQTFSERTRIRKSNSVPIFI